LYIIGTTQHTEQDKLGYTFRSVEHRQAPSGVQKLAVTE
jgi:hypothetical protein